jgi:hypothetical protein
MLRLLAAALDSTPVGADLMVPSRREGFAVRFAGVRAGLSVMTRALGLLRRRQWGDLGWRLLSEKGLVYRCFWFCRQLRIQLLGNLNLESRSLCLV